MRLRQQLMHSGSEKEVENAALIHQCKLKDSEMDGVRRERDVIQDRMMRETQALEMEIDVRSPHDTSTLGQCQHPGAHTLPWSPHNTNQGC